MADVSDNGVAGTTDALSAPRQRSFLRALVRPALDAVAVFTLCTLVTAFACGPLSAHTNPAAFAGLEDAAAPLAASAIAEAPLPAPDTAALAEVAGTNPGYHQPTGWSVSFLLIAIISMLAALNLAFFRHLRRVYAVPGSRRRRLR